MTPGLGAQGDASRSTDQDLSNIERAFRYLACSSMVLELRAKADAINTLCSLASVLLRKRDAEDGLPVYTQRSIRTSFDAKRHTAEVAMELLVSPSRSAQRAACDAHLRAGREFCYVTYALPDGLELRMRERRRRRLGLSAVKSLARWAKARDAAAGGGPSPAGAAIDDTGNVRTWAGEHVLLALLLSPAGRAAVSGARVVEIGGGATALAGFGLAAACARQRSGAAGRKGGGARGRCGPVEVVVTDGHPACVDNLRACLVLNAGLTAQVPTYVEALPWETGEAADAINADGCVVRRLLKPPRPVERLLRARDESLARRRARAGAAPAQRHGLPPVYASLSDVDASDVGDSVAVERGAAVSNPSSFDGGSEEGERGGGPGALRAVASSARGDVGGFDLVVGAGCIYFGVDYEALAHTVAALLRPGGTAWLVSARRGGCLEAFVRVAEDCGLFGEVEVSAHFLPAVSALHEEYKGGRSMAEQGASAEGAEHILYEEDKHRPLLLTLTKPLL